MDLSLLGYFILFRDIQYVNTIQSTKQPIKTTLNSIITGNDYISCSYTKQFILVSLKTYMSGLFSVINK